MKVCDRLQQPIDDFRAQAEVRLEQVAALAARYIPALRRWRPSPEEEALLEESMARLKAIHQAAERYLPALHREPSPRRLAPKTTWMLEEGRKNHDGSD